MKFKRIFGILSTVLLTCFLAACGNGEAPNPEPNPKPTDPNAIDKTVLVKKDLKLNLHSEDYTIEDDTLTTYFYKNGNVPLIGIFELVSSLDGYFDSSVLKLDITGDDANFTWKDSGNYEYYFKVDAKNDTITTNTESFFGFINSPEGIDYNRNSEFVGAVASEEDDIVFDLKPYNFDAIIYDDDLLLSYSVANSLVLTPNIANLYYNGKEFNLFTIYLDDIADFDTTRNPELRGKNLADDILEERNNGLYFILDHYYGLKEVKGIKSFKEFIENHDKLSGLFASPRYEFAEAAYKKLFVTVLDDPHSSVSYLPYYSKYDSFNPEKNNYMFTYDDIGPRYMKLMTTAERLEGDYKRALGKDKTKVRYDESGKTAFIKFDSFTVGRDEELFDADGNVKEDAWKYDTFYFMKKSLDEVRAHKGVTDVVIDLTTNGGGTLASCIDALGFLTNDDVRLPSASTLSGVEIMESYRVDTDHDGSFDDDDAYTEFKFHVLTSSYTFSAANYFTSVCKDMGIADVISQENSGGGMCAVNQSALIDGTPVNYSSPFALQSAKKDANGKFVYSEIESGIAPDIICPIEKYYDLDYVAKLIADSKK